MGPSSTIVDNGGFERASEPGLPAGWEVVPAYAGRGEATIDPTGARSGKHSLRLTPNERSKSEAFGVFAMLSRADIAGKSVTLSGYAKVEGITDGRAAVLLKTDREDWIPLPGDTGGDYVKFSKRFEISPKIPEAGLLLLVSGAGGYVSFDDIVLEQADKAPAAKDEDDRFRKIDHEYAAKINTPGWQDSVYISPDGKELYFAYLPYPQKDFMDLYFGRVSENEIKSRGPFRPGHHGGMNFDTYRSLRQEDGSWGPPENLNINSTYSLYSAKLSHDGDELYYVIRDYGANYGADDIYVSKRQKDGSWGPPVNLGPDINTEYREDTPCLSADGKTLYFGRNEREMLGWEIMVSQRVDGRWTKPVRMPEPINQPNRFKTANYQPFITADGKEFYFTRIQRLYMSKRKPDGTWDEPTVVFPQLPASGHASVTGDGRYLYILTAADKQSLRREQWSIWYAERETDGGWGEPGPVD